MFCGEIISNFVDSSEYDDKSRRGSTNVTMDTVGVLLRTYACLLIGWKFERILMMTTQAANI